jgi:anti-sigma factor RsiW
VVKPNAAEFPVVLWAITVVAALAVTPAGMVTSSWPSESVTAGATGAWPANVRVSTGPPFAGSWKFTPVNVTEQLGAGFVGVIVVIVGTTA